MDSAPIQRHHSETGPITPSLDIHPDCLCRGQPFPGHQALRDE